jgi:hypothetical protein
MRGILAFCVWLLFVSAASASPCIDLDPSGQSYPCGQGTFQLNSTAVHVDDSVVLTADLSAVEPVTNFGFLFIGSFNITSSSNSGLQYVFNGYFSGAGESDILAFFTDGFGNSGCVGETMDLAAPFVVKLSTS